MSEEHVVSRRTCLEGLGAVGAALALGGSAEAAGQGASKSVGDKSAGNVVDVATDRFVKGHS